MLHCKAISVETVPEGLTSDAVLTSELAFNITLYAKTALNITLSSIVQSTCNIDWLLYLPRHRLTESLLLVGKKVSTKYELPQRGAPAEAEQA